MKMDYVLVNIIDSVAIVTIDRPPVNANNSETVGELFEVLYKLDKDDSIKVLILTGAGEKAFVAGADVREFLNFDSETGPIFTWRNQMMREYLRKYSKPVICAINGLAMGAGCALVTLCDIKIACEEAKFSLGEINMGILGATQYIAHIAHHGLARKMVYTGEAITADEALRCGLIDEIVSRDKLMDRCMVLAKNIAAKSPLAVKLAKQCMIKSSETFLEEGLMFEEEAIKILWGTEDKNEAVNSFLEKRAPSFVGK